MLQSTTGLVRAVFKTVWLEFYQHEQVLSRQSIKDLARLSPTNSVLSILSPSCFGLPTSIQTRHSRDFFTVWVPGSVQAPDLLPVQCITSARPFSAYPPYESCTPCSQSIFLGDDPDEMPFVPFADDPDFNDLEHTFHYRQFAWQSEERNLDPDLQLIVTETARRLHSDYDITFAHMDETAVLPLAILSQQSRRGLLYSSRQRDVPAWPGASAILPAPTPPVAGGARGRLANTIATFCANLNCIQGYCARHLETIPMPTAAFPTVLGFELRNRSDKPCGRDCFLWEPIESALVAIWNECDLEWLRCILSVTPDILPCDLAVICRKPCRETFCLRRAVIPDNTVSRRSEIVSKETALLKLPVHDSGSFSPVGPCHHAGACTHDIKCPCVLNTAHCESNCACGPECWQRWRGCKCTVTSPNKVCTGQRCACVRAGRECDPERCGSCRSRDEATNMCQNSAIQKGRLKNTVVKAGAKCGLGLFLAEPVQEGELIAEYVGELVFDLTTLSRHALSIHRGRNYLFGLDTVLSLDSTHAGNTTRYANHTRRGTANAIAKVWLVNGDHRIGIHALKTIKAGTEILFDYGDEFFTE